MKVGKQKHGVVGDLYRTTHPTKRAYDIQNLETQKNTLVRPFH